MDGISSVFFLHICFVQLAYQPLRYIDNSNCSIVVPSVFLLGMYANYLFILRSMVCKQHHVICQMGIAPCWLRTTSNQQEMKLNCLGPQEDDWQ
jgi:hypothetical protein